MFVSETGSFSVCPGCPGFAKQDGPALKSPRSPSSGSWVLPLKVSGNNFFSVKLVLSLHCGFWGSDSVGVELSPLNQADFFFLFLRQIVSLYVSPHSSGWPGAHSEPPTSASSWVLELHPPCLLTSSSSSPAFYYIDLLTITLNINVYQWRSERNRIHL